MRLGITIKLKIAFLVCRTNTSSVYQTDINTSISSANQLKQLHIFKQFQLSAATPKTMLT